MPRLRNKSVRYRFLAIVLILAAGSLSSCQSSGSNSVQALAVDLSSFPVQHAMLHVPQ